jgi:hypothetical protein
LSAAATEADGKAAGIRPQARKRKVIHARWLAFWLRGGIADSRPEPGGVFAGRREAAIPRYNLQLTVTIAAGLLLVFYNANPSISHVY